MKSDHAASSRSADEVAHDNRCGSVERRALRTDGDSKTSTDEVDDRSPRRRLLDYARSVSGFGDRLQISRVGETACPFREEDQALTGKIRSAQLALPRQLVASRQDDHELLPQHRLAGKT